MSELQVIDRTDQADQAAPAPAPAAAPPSREIALHNICKSFETAMGRHDVLKNISFSVAPGERLAILGRNGAGKSTLIKILAGVMEPTSGSMHFGMSLSWPLALAHGFEGALTGYDNIRFVCDIYDVPVRSVYPFIRNFTELGDLLFVPVRSYSDGMRARLAFGLSLAIEFDCLLIDEVLGVGDQRFQEKCHYELFQRRAGQTMIAAVHAPHWVRQYCSSALVLKSGRGRVFQDLEVATAIYATL
ncbi:ABC transporter ATP-binding protein [Phreatobacter sp.]|uniref:ABC transporter ATP-binding protein n=1 Tax=Phreatobacter sp. TaxID=1966341 RepID=UPI003F72A4BD